MKFSGKVGNRPPWKWLDFGDPNNSNILDDPDNTNDPIIKITEKVIDEVSGNYRRLPKFRKSVNLPEYKACSENRLTFLSTKHVWNK